VGLGREVSTAHDEAATERRSVGNRLKKRVELRGRRTLIDVESGGWTVHAPCPKQRVAGANRSTNCIYRACVLIGGIPCVWHRYPTFPIPEPTNIMEPKKL